MNDNVTVVEGIAYRAPTTELAEADSLVALASAYSKIEDSAVYEAAGEDLRAFNKKLKDLEALRKKTKAPVLEAGKSIDALFNPRIEALEKAVRITKDGMNGFARLQEQKAAEEQRKRDEAERKARAEAEAAERAAREAEEAARKLAESATTEADKKAAEDAAIDAELARMEAEAKAQLQAQAEVIVAPVEKPVVEGISFRTRYEPEVTDKQLYVEHVACNPALLETVDVNMAALRKMATALKLGMKLPGVTVKEIKDISARSA